MNFQDISDFLDLVKNPAKADELLAGIKKQTEQLNASIETVGKASEIEKLRRQAEKALATAQTKADNILEEATAAAAKQKQAVDEQAESVRLKEEQLAAKTQEVNVKLETAKAVEADTAQREKSLRSREDQYQKDAVKLSELIKEYEEKVAKLRSVMGS